MGLPATVNKSDIGFKILAYATVKTAVAQALLQKEIASWKR